MIKYQGRVSELVFISALENFINKKEKRKNG